MNRNRMHLAPIVVTLVALAVVPLLAVSASAGAVAPSAAAAPARSAEWAYGGQGWNSGSTPVGKATLTWNASIGVDVVFNATNTSATTTELTATRTVAVTISATLKGPLATWTYNFKVVEIDVAYANITNASTVHVVGGTNVPALGILNGSLHANVTVQASLVGVAGNLSVSDYLNASGWANAQVAFTPSLGLIPLNLTGVSSWTSTANASGSAAWNVSWSYVNHGWNGTAASKSGFISGAWSKQTEVTLFGEVAGTYAKWVDHRVRTAVGLSLTGPFDLYAGILLVPHGFDLFHGAGNAYAGAGLGSSTVMSEYLFLNAGQVSARSVTAANMTAGASTPTAYVASSGATAAAASPEASGSGMTAWEQPMTPQAAQDQASCLVNGCSSSPSTVGFDAILVVVVAAAVAVALIVTRHARGRGGKPTTTPSSAPSVAGPTPPTGVDPTGSARPPV